MKTLLAFVAALVLIQTLDSCKSSSSSGPATFCDTTCLKDSMKFIKENHQLRPHVYISASGCKADTLAWSYDGMGANRKLAFTDLFNKPVHLNKDYVSCFIKDTSYAWILFNDCITGRGYQLRIVFSKNQTIGRKTTGIHSFDPKFNVADGLVVYTDGGNIFVEDMATGKKDMMTLGKQLDIDYDAIHESIDSVNITPTRAWAKVLIDKEWKTKEGSLELK